MSVHITVLLKLIFTQDSPNKVKKPQLKNTCSQMLRVNHQVLSNQSAPRQEGDEGEDEVKVAVGGVISRTFDF